MYLIQLQIQKGFYVTLTKFWLFTKEGTAMSWQNWLNFMNTLFNDLLFKFVTNVTGNNTVISPNFLVWKLCGKAQFLRSLG